MTTPSRVVREPATLWRYAGESLVVLPPGQPEPIVVRGSASLMWELLEQPCSDDEVVASVADAYAVDADEVGRHVLPILDELLSKGALRRVP